MQPTKLKREPIQVQLKRLVYAFGMLVLMLLCNLGDPHLADYFKVAGRLVIPAILLVTLFKFLGLL